MQEIFEEFDAILAALKPSQYRRFWRQWKGLESRDSDASADFSVILKMEDGEDLRDWLVGLEEDGTYSNIISGLDQWLDDRPYIWDEFEYYKQELYDFLVKKYGGAKYQPVKGLETVYSQLFGGKFRVVIPFNGAESNVAENYEEQLRQNAKGKTYALVIRMLVVAMLFFKTIGNDEEYEALKQEFIKIRGNGDSSGITSQMVKDYLVDGKYRFITNPKRVYGFGKMLDYFKKKKIDTSRLTEVLGKSYDDFVTDFHKRDTIKRNKNYVIVISRHPYDIAGMSTDRGWTSCMNLEHGEYRHYVMSSILNAALIAYFCTEDDTNINKPLGRVLIKPFVREGEKMDMENPNWILRCSKVYGTFDTSAIRKTQSWVDENWNRKIDRKSKRFQLDTDAFYGEEEHNEL